MNGQGFSTWYTSVACTSSAYIKQCQKCYGKLMGPYRTFTGFSPFTGNYWYISHNIDINHMTLPYMVRGLKFMGAF